VEELVNFTLLYAWGLHSLPILPGSNRLQPFHRSSPKALGVCDMVGVMQSFWKIGHYATDYV